MIKIKRFTSDINFSKVTRLFYLIRSFPNLLIVGNNLKTFWQSKTFFYLNFNNTNMITALFYDLQMIGVLLLAPYNQWLGTNLMED